MKVVIKRIYPLSPMQKGMLFHKLANKDSTAYFEQVVFDIDGYIDIDIFQKTYDALIERYDILRTIFNHDKFNQPMQIVLEARESKVHYKDLKNLTNEEKEIFLEKIKTKDREKGFDISKDLLIRSIILRMQDNKYKFILSFHHILMDGWCSGIIINDLIEMYHSIKNNKVIEIPKQTPYENYIHWVEKQDKNEAEQYWQDYLKGYNTEAIIPKRRNTEEVLKDNYKEVKFKIHNDTIKSLENLSKDYKVTLNIIVQAVWGILLHKYNNTDDVVFGTVVSGRDADIKDIETMVGLFINTIPIRVRCGKNTKFFELIEQLQMEALKGAKYHYCDLAQVQSKTTLKQNLINNLVIFENYYVKNSINNSSENSDFVIKDYKIREHTNYDFNMIVSPGKELNVLLSFNEQVYDSQFIGEICKHFSQALNQVAENPIILVSKIQIVSEEEKNMLLYKFNDTKTEYLKDKTIYELFEAQVEKTPDNTVVVYEDTELTYSELNEKANQLAKVLREGGVKPDSIVGIMVERSLEMMVGIMGILKAGGAYLPIDPGYPQDRIEYMLEDSNAKILLTQNHFMNKIRFDGRIVDLANKELYEGDKNNLEKVNSSSNLAYVIYTSGSTGKPKGVMIEHRNAVNFIAGITSNIQMNEKESILALTTISFDIFFLETILPVTKGLKVIIAGSKLQKDANRLCEFICENNINIIQATPSRIQLLANSDKGLSSLSKVEKLLVGGEALSQSLFEELKKLKLPKLYNMYGPTETTVWSTIKDLTGSSNVNIGKPISNTRVYIVGEDNRIQPIGVAGELCIEGDGLARGYLNRLELTEEKFVINPYGQGKRMYRTGDLARWLPNGDIECMGRIDHQVKIRGFRIELGEIQNHLLKNEEIKEAVVVDREDKKGNKYLCAYIVSDRKMTIPELRGYLSKELPDYMIPSYFMQIEKLPLTPNEKIDRKALPEPVGDTNTGVEYVASRNEIEENLVKIWSEILEVEKIGIDDEFFTLGGHSLKAIQVISMIHKELNVEVPIGEVFSNPTIRQLGEYIERSNESIYLSIKAVEEREIYKLSPAQKRLFVLNQLNKNGLAYNMPLIIDIQGKLEKERIEKIFKKLIERHESFRTSFELKNEEIVQKIHKIVEFHIEYVKANEEDSSRIVKNFIRIFDLSMAPLLRVGFIEIHPKKYILMLDMHHIISDGTSMSILTKEFAELYQGKELPELKIQYRDYAMWQNRKEIMERIKDQGKYWVDLLGNDIPELNMPLDYKRKEMQTFLGKTIYKKIQSDLVQKINLFAKKTNTTTNIILLSFYSILLSKYCGQEEIIVGMTVSNRKHVDLENIIGAFINFLPVKNIVNKDTSISKFIESQKRIIKEVYDNQEYPFEEIVENCVLQVDNSRNPIFDTMLIYHNEIDSNIDMKIDGLKFSQNRFESNTSKLDFKLDIFLDSENALGCYLEYNTSLYNEESMVQLINNYESLIEKASNDVELKISEIDIFDEEEKLIIEEKRKINGSNIPNVTLAISSTFTCDPVEEYIKWWCLQYGKEVVVKIAPYNQVFQELLNSKSLMSKNKGINLFFIQFEDWVRDIKASDEDKCEIIKNNYNKLLEAIKNVNKIALNIIGIFPVHDNLGLSNDLINYIKNLNKKWHETIREMENINILDFNEGIELYNIKEIFDPIKDKEGHMPFSDEYYAVIGTMIARRICLSKDNPFKVIAVDCDNTLWSGICGEDGPLGINIEKPYMELQKLLVKKQNEGMIIVLCSKNNEDDVWEVFEKNPNMLLKKEHISNWKINWNSKSQNIKSIAEELNLGIDSFIFIDDSAIECYDMMVNNPQVLTLQLPEDSMQIPMYLNHIWAFDKIKVTDEDRIRTKYYQEEKQRKEIQNNTYKIEDFLRELKLKIYINEMEKREIPRVAQLTQRTNQFSLSTIRRTENEIEELLKNLNMKCWTIEVEDKFGDYGLTGVIIMERRGDELFLDTLLLSCRVLGRNVEEAVLVELCRYCEKQGIKRIEADFYPTLKNKIVEEYLVRLKWYKIKADSHYVKYGLSIEENLNSVDFLECYYGNRNKIEKYEKINKEFQCILDHVGVAVKDIETTRKYYHTMGYLQGETIYDPLQDAHLALFSKMGYPTIELVTLSNNEAQSHMAPSIDVSTPYHLCYRVRSLQEIIKRIKNYDISWEIIKNSNPAVLFGGKEVLFIYVKGIGLIEFLEDNDYEYKGDLQRCDIIRISATDKENPIRFFKMLGYFEVDRIYNTINKVLSIQLTKKGSGDIELLILMDSSINDSDSLMLQSTQSYIQQICYKCNDEKVISQLLNSKKYEYNDVIMEQRYGSLIEASSIIQAQEIKYNIYYAIKDIKRNLTEMNWEINIHEGKELIHKNFMLPLKYYTGNLLLKLPIYEKEKSTEISKHYQMPRNEIECKLVEIWSETLGIEKIGIYDNFFKLGGHSLKAIILLGKIHKQFGVEISLGDIYNLGNVKSISEYMNSKEKVIYKGIKKADKRLYYPITPNQKGLYIANKNNPYNAESNIPLVLNIEGVVNKDKLQKVLIELINRHEAFRTSFEIVDEEVVCLIHDKVGFILEYEEHISEDISGIVKGFIKHFDLNSSPLMRALLLKTDEKKYTLIIDIHHIIIDGYSLNILYKELVYLYKDEKLEIKKYDMRDYLVNESEFIEDEKMKGIEQYWKGKFSDDVKSLNIPYDLNDFKMDGYKGEKVEVTISSMKVSKLTEIANNEKTTLHTVMFALYAVLLNQYSGENEIVIGSISAGRRLPEYKDIIGSFINLIPIMNKIDKDSTFIEFLNKTNENLISSYENQYFPFYKLQIDKSINTLLNFHTEEEKDEGLIVDGLKFESYDNLKYNQANLDIQVDFVIMDSEEINYIFEYNANKFKEETIKRMTKHFMNIIDQIINYSSLKISDIKALSIEEEKQILNEFNDTIVNYDKDITIHRMFEKQVEMAPNSIAIEYYNEKITYSELNEKANALARKLCKFGVKPESIVGIKVERSIEMMIGLMAILKAGGAYLPIDPEYPIERSKFMIEDSGTKIILTQQEFLKSSDIDEFDGITVDLGDDELYKGDSSNLGENSKPHNLSYIIYTSGSTGKPKGVMVEHRNVVAYINAFCHEYKISDQDVILQQASYGFDTSVEELYPVLTVGGKLIITTRSDIKDMTKLITLIEEYKITIISASPLLIYAMNQMELSKSLRLVISGGDILKKEYISNIIKGSDVYNTYGPTESTVCATYYKCSENLEDNIPIGKPIANYSVYILSKEGNIQPIGLPGELCVSGLGITRGYLNKEKLTKERFIDNSFANGQRMYKTGDLARWLPNGNVEYLGRIDNQIKIRGYRVELEEIEQVILKDSQIKDVAVVYSGDVNDNQYICAYIVSDINVNIKVLKRELYMEIPSYMIPQFIIQVANMPINVNGKLDKKRLPIPKFERANDNEYLEPRNDVEKRFCDVVREVLKVGSIGINDNLFDLGADSLKLIILLPKIQKEFDVKVSIEDMFSNVTIKEICEKIVSLDKNRYSAISKVEERAYYPASSAQKRLYMLNQLDIKSTSYNIPIAVKIKGSLDIFKVQNAFYYLVDRHEILRTTFKFENNNIVQKVNDKVEFLVEYDEIDDLNFEFEDFQKDFIRPFNLENGPLIRVKITKLNVDEFILQIDMHHIISDGQSIEILINEFNNIYSGNEVPEIKIQYKDFAVWQDKMIKNGNYKEQEEYWLGMYRDSIPKLNMTLDYEKLNIQSFEGDKVSFEIDEELVGKIKRICEQTGTTMYMVLFASYATLLANYTNDEDMIIGVPVLGRSHSDLEKVIGMFVNTLAIRVYPEASKTFREFLYEVKNTLLKSYEYQEFELERLIEGIKLERTTSGNPLFNTAFNFRNNNQSDTVLENMHMEYMDSYNKISKFDFSVSAFETKENIYFEIEYCTKLFKNETMQKLAEHYIKIIDVISQNINISLNEIELESFENEKFDMGEVEFNF
ncbi:non-ribosomal peptide synthetase [Clostridium tagluense]|uniref:non-ribosomal peptide synthetase n=1 Tax=Clostridium tagluense TaxID=360422 RepID=UPI001CF13259|nr:non-ribosomal peptide synthetase [Clostridium tagluense]MCB2298643.1 amino acid adenylation domain-containing protein [Clostridium tagluense]